MFVVDNMRLGGTELNAVRTAERLDRRRFEIRVVCLSGEGPLTPRYLAIGAQVTVLPLRNFYGPTMLLSGIRFVRLLRRERVDIVHAHDVYSNIFVAVWARIAGVPVVIASRRWWHSAPNRKLRIGTRFAFSRADAVLANSTAVAKSVADEAKVVKGKIWTITNFADESAFGFPTVEERDQLRKKWGAPNGAVVIGCVARFDPVKDHATLVRAFAALRQQGQDVFLVLVGGGSTRAATEALCESLSVRERVHSTGELNGGRNHHRGFDISVLSSISEGFPNSIVEAMAAGNPVVATDVGGNRDAVSVEETGLLVPTGSAVDLAAALKRLVGDSALRAQWGATALERAREAYAPRVALSLLEQMYGQLLGAKT
jgi:glycosyltransferase involved in cell wall biosynthesis